MLDGGVLLRDSLVEYARDVLEDAGGRLRRVQPLVEVSRRVVLHEGLRARMVSLETLLQSFGVVVRATDERLARHLQNQDFKIL